MNHSIFLLLSWFLPRHRFQASSSVTWAECCATDPMYFTPFFPVCGGVGQRATFPSRDIRVFKTGSFPLFLSENFYERCGYKGHIVYWIFNIDFWERVAYLRLLTLASAKMFASETGRDEETLSFLNEPDRYVGTKGLAARSIQANCVCVSLSLASRLGFGGEEHGFLCFINRKEQSNRRFPSLTICEQKFN